MSISTEITRIQTLRNELKNKLREMKLVNEKAKLQECVTVIKNIVYHTDINQKLDTNTTSYTIPSGYYDGNSSVSIETEEKSVSQNGTIIPSSGKVLTRVDINVKPNVQTKSVDITRNGQQVIEPDSGFVLSSVTINTHTPEPKIEQEKTINIQHNGTQEVIPDINQVLNKVIINTNVQNSGGISVPSIIEAGNTPVLLHSKMQVINAKSTTTLTNIFSIKYSGKYNLYVFAYNGTVLQKENTMDVLVNNNKITSMNFQGTVNEVQAPVQHMVQITLTQSDNISLRFHTKGNAPMAYYGAILCVNWDNTF